MEVKVTKFKCDSMEELINKVMEVIGTDFGMGKSEVKKEPKLNIPFFIERIARKQKMSYEETDLWLDALLNTYPVAVFNILSKEIAVYLDKKYDEHIRESKDIFVISTVDGCIHKLPDLDNINNFNNFAAFRTFGDAAEALRILEPLHRKMFNYNK